jgi:methionine-gamma-lyase
MTGATLSPMLCFLVLRSLKTLALRMRQHSESALRIAQFLAAHPKVKIVRYPLLESSSGYAVAKQQMTQGGGMLSLDLHTGYDGAIRMMDRLQLIARAVSLGDSDSLIMHPGARITARQKVEPLARLGDGITMGLMRLSVGLEDCDDLIADLDQALDVA